MKLKKLLAVGLATAVACSTVLVGCGSSGGDTKTQTSKSGTKTGNDKEVVIWDYFETDAQKEMMNIQHHMYMCLLLIMRNSLH